MAKEKSKIGVWLNHSVAHLITVKDEKAEVEKVESGMEEQLRYKGEKADGTRLGKRQYTHNEHQKHQKEQNVRNKYYKTLAAKLERYEIIHLFGPTTAKNELLNWLHDKKKTNGKTITVESAKDMSLNQMIARVRLVLESVPE